MEPSGARTRNPIAPVAGCEAILLAAPCYCQPTQDYADQLQLCCGMDGQILEFFAWGSRSWVAGASNFIAREHVALYRACVVDQAMVAGRKLAQRLIPMLNLLEQGGKFCQYVKYGCELAGLPVGPTRRQLLPLNPTEKAHFKQLYERLQQA